MSTRDARPRCHRRTRDRAAVELGFDGFFDLIGELAAFRVEELDAVVVVQIVRRADDDAEIAFELAREIGDARSGQRTDQHDVDARGDEAGFERGFEHVARQARVLADEHRAALGGEHARRRARQAQREIHGHRMFADSAAHAVGAEILTCHRIPLPGRRGGHADRVDRGGHVVGAHDTRSVENRNGGQCDAARSSFVDHPARELGQHGLA